MIEKDQKVLANYLVRYHNVRETTDNRGWYIVDSGINGGMNYLYNDGIIRYSVSHVDRGDAVAFWETADAASAFFLEWEQTIKPLDEQFEAFAEKFADNSELSKDEVLDILKRFTIEDFFYSVSLEAHRKFLTLQDDQ